MPLIGEYLDGRDGTFQGAQRATHAVGGDRVGARIAALAGPEGGQDGFRCCLPVPFGSQGWRPTPVS